MKIRIAIAIDDIEGTCRAWYGGVTSTDEANRDQAAEDLTCDGFTVTRNLIARVDIPESSPELVGHVGID